MFLKTRFWIQTMLAAAVFMGVVSLGSTAQARPPRVLKFQGVPLAQGQALRKKFPFVFEREVTLSEVDEITRFLMGTGLFSNIEVVERNSESGPGRELVLVGSILRRIHDVQISGNFILTTGEISRVLNVKTGDSFERKNLLAAASDLREEYERRGYHNARVEIEFGLPNDNEVNVKVEITEGTPVRVMEVAVDSPNESLNRALARKASALKNRKLTEDELIDFQKDVADYLHDNRYLTARISSPSVTTNAERTQAKLVYSIDNPYRYEFRFTGNSYFSDGSLISRIEESKFSGATTSPAPDMAEQIRRMYQAVGFANVEVSFVEERGSGEDPYRDLISFKINENPRVRIKKIEITGNISRPESYYTQFITSSSSDLIGSGFYNRHDIDDGAKKLITELQNQGYLRAKVQSQRAEYAKDRTSVTVSLNLDEGPLTQVRQIRFSGESVYQPAQLQNLVKIHAGAALSLKDLEESLKALKDFYHDEGFLEMRILNEGERNKIVTYNDTNTQATIDIQIYEGPRVVVREIALKGNTFTKDNVITRELTFKPGDVLTPTKMNESLTRLQTLGFFSHVNIRTLEEGSSIAERTVQIEVSEANPGLFSIGAGVTNERQLTFRGYAGVSYRNLGGTGRGVVLRVDPKYSTDPEISYLENRETFSYIEPYVFGDRNIARLNVIRDQSYYGRTGTGAVQILETNSVGVILERDLAKNIKLTYTAYNFANRKSFDRKTYEISQTLNVGKTGPLIEFDFRDNPFYPSKGSYSFLSGEYSDPLLGSSDDATQSVNYWKAVASHTFYQRIVPSNPDWVWATSVRGGLLRNVSGKPQSGVPSEEAFFLGGRSTIRGYDSGADERIPSNFDLGIDDLLKFYMRTHSEYLLVKSEVRFPIWKNFPIGPLGGVLFYDGGAVYLHEPGLDISDPYRDSVGAGLRIATPVGPLNLEIGWKLDARQSKPGNPGTMEKPWAFHFSIGSF
jgi:outer membrane protein assembly complex protein YaeT